MKKRLFRFVLPVIALLAGAAIFLHFRRGDSDAGDVPAQFQQAISDKEIQAAAVKWKQVLPAVSEAVAVPPLDLKKPLRLAIGSLGKTNDSQNGMLGDLVLTELSGDAGFNVVERQSLEKALQEMGLGLSGLVRANDAVRAGKLLKADWFLLGTEAKINGTNSLVIRLVDARTGVFQDAGIFPADKPATQLAADIVGFIRVCRQNAAAAKSRIYLAVGAFEDLSVNNRQASFPTQLRGYLMSSFRGTNITLLEREHVDALLNEMELDLAGLTETSNGSAQPMQSAFWLVTGRYQSFENNGYEVEVLLKITRIFGLRPKTVVLQGAPGDALFRQVQQVIEAEVNKNEVLLVPSRRTEAINQLDIGKNLFGERGKATGSPYVSLDGNLVMGLLFTRGRDAQLKGEEAVRRKQNLLEAVRAFQTVLILEPTNRQAKLYMGACLLDPIMERPKEEARECYRQMLEEDCGDRWASVAQTELMTSFDGEGPWGQQPWYTQAAARSINPKAKAYFEEQAARATHAMGGHREAKATVAENEWPTVLEQAKTNLLKEIQEWVDRTGHLGLPYIMQRFRDAFGTNESSGARALVDLMPELAAKFPGYRPYLEGAIVQAQVDMNAPIIAEFVNTLDWCETHPGELKKDHDFWGDMNSGMLSWCYDHGSLGIAAKIIAHTQKSRAPDGNYVHDERLVLALEYFEHEQWKNALSLFQLYSNRPVYLDAPDKVVSNRWVHRAGIMPTGRYAAACERNLGLPHISDPREFQPGKACLNVDAKSHFLVDAAGLWLAGNAELRQLDFDLKEKLRTPLPLGRDVRITCMCSDETRIWLGTDGAGLLEINKIGKECRRFTGNEGMLMDSVSQLNLAGTSLWIGYGQKRNGGLGVMDLGSQHVRSYTPAFAKVGDYDELAADPPDGPPRHPVTALAGLPEGNLLALVADKGLQRFSVASNLWEMLPNQHNHGIASITANNHYRVEGVYIGQVVVEIAAKANRGQTNQPVEKKVMAVSAENIVQVLSAARADTNVTVMPAYGLLANKGGLDIYDLKTSHWQSVQDPDGLPSPPGTMTWDGDALWVGGDGYIANVDMERRQVRKFCYAPAAVNQIQIGGGYLWAMFDNHLYRVSLSDF